MAPFSPEPPVSGHVFRMRRKSGERWMAKWRDAGGQHQKVLVRAYTGRGRPPEGYLTKPGPSGSSTRSSTARAGRVPAKRARSELVTLAQAAEEWIEYLEVDRRRRPATIRDYRRALRTKLLPAFRDGKVPIEWITVAAVERFREQLVYRERLAPTTVNKYLVMLHGILKRAQRRHGLAVNVVARVERQPIRRSGDFRVLSPTEVEALGRAGGSTQDAAIFRVAAYTGLRLGELLALRWRDADFEKRLVHVRRSYTADEEGMPKSGRVRSVPMIDQVAAVLDGLSEHGGAVGDATRGWVLRGLERPRLSVDARQVSLGEPLLTAADAAALLSVRPSWIYEAVRDGRLPCVRVGRHVRFLRSDLEDWVRKQRAPGRA